MAGIVNEAYRYNISVEKSGLSLEDVRVYILDVKDVKVTDQYTDSNGEISQQELVAEKYTVTGPTSASTTSASTKNPHDVRALKYGTVLQQIAKNLTSPATDTIFLTDNQFTTASTSAGAASATGIIIQHPPTTPSGGFVIVTQDTTIQKIYDYVQVEAVINPQAPLLEVINTIDGNTYNCFYNFTVSGANVDATGTLLFMPTRVFTISGGSYSGRVTDKFGTQAALTLTGLVSGTEVRVLSAGTTTELGGVENSGTSYSFNYLHTVDFDVDVVIHNVEYVYQKIEGVTLTALGTTIPVQQRFDRVYNNP